MSTLSQRGGAATDLDRRDAPKRLEHVLLTRPRRGAGRNGSGLIALARTTRSRSPGAERLVIASCGHAPPLRPDGCDDVPNHKPAPTRGEHVATTVATPPRPN